MAKDLKMKLSIIIVAYNEEKAIAKCLQSIKKQIAKRKDIEIIVIDDNSTDNTAKIVKNCGVKVFSFHKNKGISICRNTGVKKTKGKYLIFFDAHIYLKGKNIFKTLEEHFEKNPKIAGISGFYETWQKKDFNFTRDLVRETFRKKRKRILPISFTDFTTFSSCIGAIRRKAFKIYSFPQDYKDGANEDTLFQLILMNKNKKFLHLGSIQCWHDAELSFKELIKKLFYQARGFNNLLYSLSDLNLEKIPFSAFFLDFPLSFLLLPFFILLSCIANKFLLLTWFVFFGIDFYKTLKVFKTKNYSLRQKIISVFYIIFNEFTKAIYFPYYLIKKKYNLQKVFYVLKLFVFWESFKINPKKKC